MKYRNLLLNSRPISDKLKLLSNRHRLEICCLIANSEKSVGELISAVGMSQSALSQHLGKLRSAKVVKTRRDAQVIYYSLSSRSLETFMGMLEDLAEETQEPIALSA